MKKILSTLLFLNMFVNAQIPNWQWIKSEGGSGNDISCGISKDANGNIFICGSFSSPSIAIGAFTLNNSGIGTNNMFIAKYNSSGNVIWAKANGGSNSYGISVDANGNAFVTGAFTNTVTFGTNTLTSTGNGDVYVTKYDSNGNVLWAQSAGGTGSDQGNGVSTDINGNVFVTGQFFSPLITFSNTILTNPGGGNIFTVKYDAGGNVLWAKSAGGNGACAGKGISTDVSGNVIVIGDFGASIVFGTNNLSSAGSADIFIVKYSPNGTELWATSAGGTGDDRGNAICTDNVGNIFITGQYYSTSMILGTTVLSQSGVTDIFISKYDIAGNEQWAKSGGGVSGESGYGICTDSGGNVYTTGYFQSPTFAFGTSTVTGTSNEMFFVKHDPNGAVIWLKSIGGANSDIARGITVDIGLNVFVTGDFASPTISVETTTINNISAPSTNIFVGKLSQCNVPPSPADITPLINKNICSLASTTLFGTSTGTISWFLTATSGTVLANGSSFVTPILSTGNYTYYAEAYTCTKSISRTAITLTVNECLNSIYNHLNSVISIYPNPVKDILHFGVENNSLVHIVISNIFGEILLQQNSFNISEGLDMRKLESGIYFLTIIDPTGGNMQKIIRFVKE